MRGNKWLVAILGCAALGVVVAGLVAQTAPAADKRVTIKAASDVPVVFDGNVSKFEYADAAHATFPNGHGTVDVYVKVQDGYLYFGCEIPDLSPFIGDDMVIMLDTKNARSAAPDAGDTRAYVRRKIENSRMEKGDGKAWKDDYSDWEYKASLYANGWEVEARIPLKSLGVDGDKGATMGLAFRIWDNQPEKMHYWPAGSNEKKPDTWGTLAIEASK